MPRAGIDKQNLYTFVGGLNTEATGLTFPENSLVAGDNIDVELSGLAKRRLGIDYELNYQLSTETYSPASLRFDGISYHNWDSVGVSGILNLLVIQIANTLYLYNKGADPLSSGYITSIDITDYLILIQGGGKDLTTLNVTLDSATLEGKLFLVGPVTEPIVLEYSPVEETITLSTLNLKIRDFEGVDDGLSIDQRPSILSPEKEYNLMNQGWVETVDSGLNQGANTSQTGPSSVSGNSWESRQEIVTVIP